MISFDSTLLAQYFDLGLTLKVYVYDRYLVIPSLGDLNKESGTGYDANGSAFTFRYENVDHIKIGEVILTKDTLNQLVLLNTPKPLAKPLEQ